jgi:8-oxo-dGTP diphosphatase
MLKYTICFIKRNHEILLLNRNKKPNMGKWNGVGGKIEKFESPYDSIIRESMEETGIKLKEVIHCGNVTWKSNRGESGMYVFIAEIQEEEKIITPIKMNEGILDWKQIEWILSPDNSGVVDNIKIYLPEILNGNYGLEHKFIYENGVMIDYTTSILLTTVNP